MVVMDSKRRSVLTISSAASALLPVLFILKSYSYGIDDLYLTGAIALSILCIISSSGKVRIEGAGRVLILFTLIWIFRLFLNSVFGATPFAIGTVKVWLEYLLSSVVIAVLVCYLERDLFYKSWKVCGYIVGAAIIVQSFQIYVLGQSVYPIQLMTPVLSSVTGDAWHSAITRPVAFFTEPAATCSYLLPLIFLAIRNKEMKNAMFFSVLILLTTSTSGLICTAFLWMFYAFSRSESKKMRFGIVVAFIAFFIIVTVTPLFNDTISKLQLELSGESNNFFGRVVRGWLMFFTMDGWGKLFGANMSDLTLYVQSHPAMMAMAPQIATKLGHSYYFNTAHRIVLQTGILGGAVYALVLRKIYKLCDRSIAPYFWMVILEMFFTWNLFTSNYYMIQMFVILGFGLQRINQGESERGL